MCFQNTYDTIMAHHFQIEILNHLGMKTKKNRWLMALAAVGIHICIGSVYAWSVYTKPILTKMAHLDWTLFDVTLTFSIAITFLGLSAAVMGKFVERKGPRIARAKVRPPHSPRSDRDGKVMQIAGSD